MNSQIDRYTLDDLHYNSSNILQISQKEQYEDMQEIHTDLKSMSEGEVKLEMNMFSFFENEVIPILAYRDDDPEQARIPTKLDYNAK